MVTKQIYWGDGTSDQITLTFSGIPGESFVTVSSDPNISADARSKNLTVKTDDGATTVLLELTQESLPALFHNGYLRPDQYLFLKTRLLTP